MPAVTVGEAGLYHEEKGSGDLLLVHGIPKMRIATISGTGHFPHLGNPRELNLVVEDFLAEGGAQK
jgi:hypothetical protein